MKVLVVNLLRIGDLVMSAPILKGIKESCPEAEVHLLMNKQFSKIAPLMPYADKVIGFDRAYLQDCLKSKEVGYFEAYERMSHIIKNLKNEKYDIVINLTHNRLSGYLCELIKAKQVLGLKLGHEGFDFGSDAFSYLNNHALSRDPKTQHMIDALLAGSRLIKAQKKIVLKETESGFREAKKLLKNQNVDLLIQPLTSDKKKNWGLENFKEFVRYFRLNAPKRRIAFLCSPQEELQIRGLWKELKEQGIYTEVFTCSLEGAYSIMKKSKALLTLDTSLKHIAAATHIRIIELSLGSSFYSYTGVYKHNSYIVQSKQDCAPCSHAISCPFVTNICKNKIEPDLVADVVSQVLCRNEILLQSIAEINIDKVEILKTTLNQNLGWTAHPIVLNEQALLNSSLQLIEKSKLLQLEFDEELVSQFKEILIKVYRSEKKLSTVFLALQSTLFKMRYDLHGTGGSSIAIKNLLQNTKYSILKEILEYASRSRGFVGLSEVSKASDFIKITKDATKLLDQICVLITECITEYEVIQWQKDSKQIII